MERRQGGQAERMSDVKRYDAGLIEKARPDGTGTMYVYAISEKSDGSFVSYEDLAHLKAEVERLTAELSNISAWGRGLESDLSHARVEISFLKAEVERLRKAGDALAKRTEFFQKRWDGDELCQEVEAWNAAKEGKPSV